MLLSKRDKVSGIGIEIKKLMEINNISVKELSKKSKLSKRKIKKTIKLKKEPYVIPEMTSLLRVLTDKKNALLIVNKWFELVKPKENV